MPPPRVSAARLEGLWQQARDPIFYLSAERKLIWANRAWEELTGHLLESVAGMVCQVHGPTRAGDLSGLGGSFCPPPEALAGHATSTSTLIIHASGERLWRRVAYWPFLDIKGELLGLFAQVCPPEASPALPDSDAHRLRSELLEIRSRLHGRYGYDSLIGDGPAHRRMLEQVAAAAANTAPVLIMGEAGTGKRTVARAIHHQGARRLSAFLPFDGAALPPDIMERELFGVSADGTSSHLCLPDGATVLIEEVLELPRDLQKRLAGVLEPSVRLLATTCGDIEAARREERLRSDFYYALTTCVIPLLPLRERLEEMPVLAQHLLEKANLRGSRQRSGFSDEAIGALLAYDWPGNLRELARVIEDAHERGEGDRIELDDLPAGIRGHLGAAYLPPTAPSSIPPLDELLTQVERRLIESAMARARQNKSRAAEILGISRPRLYRRIKELNLPDLPESADEAPAVDGDGVQH